jgi:hypothetical protein
MSEPVPEPVPWGVLSARLREGRAIPFLGAGASAFQDDSTAASRPPTGAELMAMLANDLELGEVIRCNVGNCKHQLIDLARVASYYQLVGGTRADLDRVLRDRLSPPFKPNSLHRLLARAARRAPMLIITTNYDSLIEGAFDHPADEAENGPVPYEVVVTAADRLAELESDRGGRQLGGWLYHRVGGEEPPGFRPLDPGKFVIDIAKRSVIYKIHGSIPCGGDWEGGFLIAEEDYARFLGRIETTEIVPPAIKSFLSEKRKVEGAVRAREPKRSLLFLGYGLKDWNLRVLLDSLGIGQGVRNAERHHAFQRGCDPMERALLESRNMLVFDVDLATVVARIEQGVR